MKKKKFSTAEKNAYYMGVGAALTGGRFEKIKQTASQMPAPVKKSFYNGFDSVVTRAK